MNEAVVVRMIGLPDCSSLYSVKEGWGGGGQVVEFYWLPYFEFPPYSPRALCDMTPLK